jgi:glutaryl-CoA dehydrogenase
MATPTTAPYLDFLGLESLLTEEQKLTMKTTRDFVQREMQRHIQEAYRVETFPEGLARRMGTFGLLGSFLTGYGLPGLDSLSYGLIMRELERCDSGLRSFASVQGGLVMYPISEFGDDSQKEKWLPPLGKGEAIGCFALTESEGGSDPGSMRTVAEKNKDGWLLNGSKMWITNGNLSQIAIVWAKTADGIRAFLVPTDLPGFKAVRMKNKLSLRASVTSELYFENVRLPLNSLLPKSAGIKSALQCLNQARYGIAWGVLGAAEACFSEALTHANQRIVFGKSLAHFQLVQRKLAIMASQITQGQLLAWRLSELKAKGDLHHSHISMAKQNNVEMALNVARTSRDILGASGIMDEYASMRHMCNLETVFTYEGTNDIHLLVVGQQLTGTSAFS